MSKASCLRDLLRDNEIIVAPGAHDPLSAKIIESMGFPLVYVGGFVSSAVYLGEPDVGLMSFAEVVDNLRRINMAIDIPVIADADTGYGNVINVLRTIRCYEEAGIAGLHIEDQVLPKKCGHVEGKQLVSVEEMVQKIKASVYARTDPDFLIIARTDARAVTGFDDAVRRCHAYEAAGADMLFLEAPQTIEELDLIGKIFKVPVLFNAACTGKSPAITISQARDLGFKLMIYPIELLMACCHLMKDMLSNLKKNDGFEFSSDRMMSHKDFNEFMGMYKYFKLEQKFAKEASNGN